MESSKTYSFGIDYGARVMTYAATAMPAKLDLRGSTHMANGEMVVTKVIADQIKQRQEEKILNAIKGHGFTSVHYDEARTFRQDDVEKMLKTLAELQRKAAPVNQYFDAYPNFKHPEPVADPNVDHPAYGLF